MGKQKKFWAGFVMVTFGVLILFAVVCFGDVFNHLTQAIVAGGIVVSFVGLILLRFCTRAKVNSLLER